MSDVIRVFVEKKPGFDVEARHIRADLVENLGLASVTDVKLLNRYDISGMSAEEFAQARDTIFSEPNVDRVYEETYEAPEGYRVFAMEYLPGQYDQRADSAAQCVQLLTQGERPQVVTARVVAIGGNVSDEELERIEHYMVNPVESRLASLEKPESLDMKADVPADVARVTGFISWDDAEMDAFYGKMGFAMSREDLFFCRDYFRDSEHRDPTVTELRVIDTYWSDHCRHTTFSTRLTDIEVEKSPVSAAIEEALRHYFTVRDEVYGQTDRPVSLMDMAVIGTKGSSAAALCRISTRAMRSTPARSRYRSRSTAKPRIGWFSSRMKHTTTRRRLSRSAARRRALAARSAIRCPAVPTSIRLCA